MLCRIYFILLFKEAGRLLIAIFLYSQINVVYVNAFSGDATIEFPSALEMARGGVSSTKSVYSFLTSP